MKPFHSRFRSLLGKARHIKLADVAYGTSITRSRLSEILNNWHEDPTEEEIQTIERFFEIQGPKEKLDQGTPLEPRTRRLERTASRRGKGPAPGSSGHRSPRDTTTDVLNPENPRATSRGQRANVG